MTPAQSLALTWPASHARATLYRYARLARPGPADALLWASHESGYALFDEKCEDSVLRLFSLGVSLGVDDVGPVGDPELGSVEDVVVSVLLCSKFLQRFSFLFRILVFFWQGGQLNKS